VAARDLLLTGASGFVGRHLLARATAAGLGAQPCDWDLRDAELTARRLAELRPAAVVHLAASPRGGDAWKALADDVRMAGALIAGLAEHAPDAPLLATGSAAQYGRGCATALREDDPTAPLSPYGALKCALEEALTAGPLRRGVRVSWTRSFNHVGPGQGDDAPVAQWVAQIAAAERAGSGELRTGRLDVVRDFLDVRDVADAYLALVACDTAEGVVNVCSGTATELRVLAELLVEQARVPVALVRDPALERGNDPQRVVGDPARLRELTGWRPRVTLERSVAEMLALARERVRATAGVPA